MEDDGTETLAEGLSPREEWGAPPRKRKTVGDALLEAQSETGGEIVPFAQKHRRARVER